MEITVEILQQGVIIMPNGKLKKYSKNIKDGELFVIFSGREVKSELKNDGKVFICKGKRIFIRKTPKQAIKEALMTHLYFSCVSLERSRL